MPQEAGYLKAILDKKTYLNIERRFRRDAFFITCELVINAKRSHRTSLEIRCSLQTAN
jgi:hypothetical protein